MNIGEKIKFMREKYGFSMNHLSKVSGASQSAISEIEAGKRQPTFDMLERIISGFEVSLSDFFTEDTENKKIHYNKAVNEITEKVAALDASEQAEVLQVVDAILVRKKYTPETNGKKESS